MKINKSLGMNNYKVLLFAFAWLFSQSLNATIYFVKPIANGNGNGTTWANASNNLQAIINAAVSGDQIWVAAGTYKPSTLDRNVYFTMKNNVAIYGGFNGSETLLSQRNWTTNVTVLSGDLNDNDVLVFDGNTQITGNEENSEHVFYNDFFNAVTPLNASAILDGFTIKGGKAGASSSGGGMYNLKASPTLVNLIFIGNQAGGSGGGMYNSLNSNASLTNITFDRNYAFGGGSGGGGGMANYTSANVTLENVLFLNNKALSTGGGGMWNFQNTIVAKKCKFISNVGRSGGAITLLNTTLNTFENCSFVTNSASNDGGSGWIEGSTASFTNCIFASNAANTYGGMMYNRGSNITITNATIFNNATLYPGGAYQTSGVMYIDGTNPITNIKNTILWANHSFSNNSSTFNNTSPIITYSNVQGGYVGTANINNDPVFVNTSNIYGADNQIATSDDGLQLQPCSPSVNTGSNAAISLNLDIVGQNRNFNNVDMGPYEVPSNTTQLFTLYRDTDGDGYGNAALPKSFCSSSFVGYANNNTDCDDSRSNVYPGAIEVCDGLDNDCNGQIDNGNVCTGIVYVKANASGLNNGTSWTNAFTSLQSALTTNIPNLTQIWVAAGTYKPTNGAVRTVFFEMKNGVAIYGGFNGTETLLSQRNWKTNVSILSADIGIQGNNSDNSFNVINQNPNYSVPGLNNTAVLDGFTITGGNTTGANSSDNAFGGGMYNKSGSSPTVNNCIFENNQSADWAGAVYNNGGSSIFTNCIFRGNSSPSGAAVMNNGGAAKYINCVFSGNRVTGGLSRSAAYDNGNANISYINCTFSGNLNTTTANNENAAIFNTSANTTIKNCIIWDNPGDITTYGGSINISNSIVQGGYPGINNINIDPLFVNPIVLSSAPNVAGNYRLKECSPAIDAGENAANLSLFDADNNPRKYVASSATNNVDLGAYELQTNALISLLPLTTSSNALNFDGINDYVEINNCNNITIGGNDAITIEYWFKGTNLQSAVRLQTPDNKYIVAGWNGGVSGAYQHIISTDGGTNGIQVGSAATDGSWHHVALTWQRNTTNGFKSYLDGALIAQRNTNNNSLPSFTTNMYLGSYIGISEFMNGTLDEVRLWSVARTQAEIQADMYSCGDNIQPGLQLYYKFDHGAPSDNNNGNNAIKNYAQPASNIGLLANFALNNSTSNWVVGRNFEGIEWLGNVDSDWANPGNWSCGHIPEPTSTVILSGAKLNYPNQNLNVIIFKLQVENGASLTIPSGQNFKIIGN